jgi:hypothetical protein
MDFGAINEWGYVNPDTVVVDKAGNRFVVERPDAKGFVKLRNLSGGKDEVVEALDPVDHSHFKSE